MSLSYIDIVLLNSLMSVSLVNFLSPTTGSPDSSMFVCIMYSGNNNTPNPIMGLSL